MITHEQAEPYVSFIADDAGSFRKPAGLPCDNPTKLDWLIGWQCGFEPLFVRVRSYLPDTHLDIEEAIELATDGLAERNWFTNEPTEPDHILEPIGG